MMKLFWLTGILTCVSGLLTLVAADQVKKSLPGVKPIQDPPGIHHLFALGTNVYSGSTPDSDQGFATLAKFGVKTIISVDGARPDVQTAKKHGLRYVHLPHGYDGISSNLQLQLAKATEALPGPIYVHCHHGQHRGPAAAAILCMAGQAWSPDQAKSWLFAAGTSTNYVGLFDTVRKFQKPTSTQLQSLSSDFPETAQLSGLVDSMVAMDQRWEHLKAIQAAGYTAPADHPDIVPADEALMLWEHYREAQRLPESNLKGDQFIEHLQVSEVLAKEAHRLLLLHASSPAPALRARLDTTLHGIQMTCTACHKTHRDPSGIKAGK